MVIGNCARSNAWTRTDELSSFYFYRGKPKLLFFNVNFISYHSASLSQPGLLVSFHLEICQAPNMKCQSIFTFEIAVLHAFRFLFHLMTTLVRINSYKNFIHFPQKYVNRCIYQILLSKTTSESWPWRPSSATWPSRRSGCSCCCSSWSTSGWCWSGGMWAVRDLPANICQVEYIVWVFSCNHMCCQWSFSGWVYFVWIIYLWFSCKHVWSIIIFAQLFECIICECE